MLGALKYVLSVSLNKFSYSAYSITIFFGILPKIKQLFSTYRHSTVKI
jgi:hypothetical protein